MHFLSPDLIRREVSSLLAGTFKGEAYLAYMDRVEVTMLDSVDVTVGGEQIATANLANLQTSLQEFSSKVLMPALFLAYSEGRFGGVDAMYQNPLMKEVYKEVTERLRNP